ncbi:Hyaluronan synthase [compost metagenome]
MISFIIPAKNVSLYIKDCLFPFISYKGEIEFEVIIVDDGSTDDTLQLLLELEVQNNFLKIFQNPFKGKVEALNFGYSKSKGSLIKCIDSDDVISIDLLNILSNQKVDESIFHDGTITDQYLNHITYFSSNSKIVNASYNDVVKHIISPPRWAWSFSRNIGDKIFPMPKEIPYEDIWFAFSIKKYSTALTYLPKSYYLYRQHDNQTFGGVMNFGEEKVRFRANRFLTLLPIIKSSHLGENLPVNLFNTNISFFEYIAKNKWKMKDFLKLENTKSNKLRFFLILFYPKIAGKLLEINWKLRKKIK